MTDDAFRAALKSIRWLNTLSDGETFSDAEESQISPATKEIFDALEESDNAIQHAPIARFSLQVLIEFGIDHGFFDDQFPQWKTENSLLDDSGGDTDEWAKTLEFIKD